MKRIVIIVFAIMFCKSPLFSQNVNIPDAHFLYALISGGVDVNDDGLISYEEAEAVHLLNLEENSISDLTGIEAFSNIDTLHCYYNDLISLDVSNNNALTYLNCAGNNLTSLDVSDKTALTYLNCADNQLTSLDVSKNALITHLYCSDNQLTNLDVSDNPGLINLHCGGNDLTDLDVTKNPLLEELYCGCISDYLFPCDHGPVHNTISSLDVSANKNLRILKCDGNELSSLDLSNNTMLTELSCRENAISSLNIRNSITLTYLDCSGNQMVNLDVSGNDTLIDLYCESNNLISLDVSNNTVLTSLFCANNQLSVLDLSNNTELRYVFCGSNKLTDINISECRELLALHCDSNQLTTLDISNNSSLEAFACYKHIWCSIGVFTSNLNISNMPSLSQVCVWETFTPESISIDSASSPGVCFTADCTIGVKHHSQKEISIYPNPTSNFLTIETARSGPHSIEIILLSGQQIYSTTMEETTMQINMTPFTKGVYYVKVRSKVFVWTEKIVKL